jgi:prepilin peptidase CpaA
MVGAFIGAGGVWQAALASLVAGGILSIVYVLLKGTAQRLYKNLTSLFRMSVMDTMTGTVPSFRVETAASAGRLPYGIAIAMGTISFLVLRQLAVI